MLFRSDRSLPNPLSRLDLRRFQRTTGLPKNPRNSPISGFPWHPLGYLVADRRIAWRPSEYGKSRFPGQIGIPQNGGPGVRVCAGPCASERVTHRLPDPAIPVPQAPILPHPPSPTGPLGTPKSPPQTPINAGNPRENTPDEGFSAAFDPLEAGFPGGETRMGPRDGWRLRQTAGNSPTMGAAAVDKWLFCG